MKYLETKHERDSAKMTTLIVVILLLLLFVVGPPYMDPPEEYGIAVNFGNSSVGSGTIQPTKPVKSEPKQINETPQETQSEQIQEEAAASEAIKEDVITQETEEALAIKKQKAAVAKAKAQAEAEAKAEAERVAKEKQIQEEKKKKLDALIGGVSESEGSESGSEGNDTEAGDKGQLNGDPYAPSYFGDPGTGSGGKGYGLGGRGKAKFTKVIPDCQEEGRVVVEIHVNRAGNVIKAIPGKKGTTGGSCLFEAAKKTALSHKWQLDSNAPNTQIGWVEVNFSLVH